MLNNRDTSNKYMITLRNKFNTLQKISKPLTSTNKYKNLVNTHMEAAGECIPTKLRTKPRVPWETFTVRKKCDNV